jgi:hypothetical protein
VCDVNRRPRLPRPKTGTDYEQTDGVSHENLSEGFLKVDGLLSNEETGSYPLPHPKSDA